MNRYLWQKRIRKLAFYLVLLIILAPFLFVFYWMFLSSFKTQVQNTAMPPVWVVAPNLRNYREVFITNPFAQYTLNSLIIATGATLLGLILGTPAAYSIARYKQQGLGLAILTARITPGISFLVPWFILFTRMKLIDTYAAMILTHLIITLPLIVWMLVGFFEDLPEELADAAMVDGATVFGTFWKIAVPLVRPGIAASAILAFIFSWNNFMFSLVIASYRTKPLPVAVFNFMSYTEINWGGLTAAASIITLPVMLLVLLVQRNIVRGLVVGAVKG
jgi:multiple sugar transport system permease protein